MEICHCCKWERGLSITVGGGGLSSSSKPTCALSQTRENVPQVCVAACRAGLGQWQILLSVLRSNDFNWTIKSHWKVWEYFKVPTTDHGVTISQLQ